MSKQEIYISIDVETTGPVPGLYSMLSLGAARFDYDGSFIDSFGINLDELPEAGRNTDTMKWWKEQPPGTWELCRKNLVPPSLAIRQFEEWLTLYLGQEKDLDIISLAWPAAFDHMWVNWYGWKYFRKYLLGYDCIDVRSFLQGFAGTRSFREIKEEDVDKLFGHPDYEKPIGPLTPHLAEHDAIKQGVLYFHWRNRLAG